MPIDAADMQSGRRPSTNAETPPKTQDARIQGRRTARLGLGTTVSFLVALWFDWTLAYLVPVFAAPMLLAAAPPSLGATVRTVVLACAIMVLFYLVGGFARAYPGFFLLALWPALYLTLRHGQRNSASLVFVLALLGLILVPMVAKISMDVTWDVAASSVWNVSVALVVTLAMFTLLPPLSSEKTLPPKPKVSIAEADRRALIGTLITGSYSTAYFAFDWTNVHTPIYIAVFVQQVSLAHGRTMTKGIMAANVVAGCVAWVLYELFVMVPNLLFVALLSIVVFMIFAKAVTSSSSIAPLAGAGLSVLTILLGSAMISWGDDQADKFIDRLGEIGMAAVYAVSALYLLERLLPMRRYPQPGPETAVSTRSGESA